MMYLVWISDYKGMSVWRMCAHHISNAELKLNSPDASQWTATMNPAKVASLRLEVMGNSQMGRLTER